MLSIAPRYYGDRQLNGYYYVEIENVLRHFKNPAIMDIKMGCRTYVEGEVTNATKCRDLYEKMISIDKNEPTIDEHGDKAITKLRYMQFRENLSSSSNLGFRIDAAKLPEENKSRNNFQRTKTAQQVGQKLEEFLRGRETTLDQILHRLKEIRDALATSHFFQTHELIGSSLLVVYDQRRTGVWMIDFHNTTSTIDGRTLTHVDRWQMGNHEDGYLFGLNNLIQILSGIKI
jgi:1D-myo-inositol-triphosphate 3-kinase